MSKVKLCGLFRESDITYANEAKPDYVGFVFAKSKRQISMERANEFRMLLSKKIKAVGVFVDEQPEFIQELCIRNCIDLIQLHGNEDIEYIYHLKSLLDVPIIKAVRVQSPEQILEAEKLPVDFLLLDTYSQNAMGGTGECFDWKLIPQIEKPYFLAGGINLKNISEAKKVQPYCIDVSSGVETDGVKDKDKMIEMVRRIRL